MKTEERKKLCKIRSDKKTKILINRAKMATKEILCRSEETLQTINEVIYAGAYVVIVTPSIGTIVLHGLTIEKPWTVPHTHGC